MGKVLADLAFEATALAFGEPTPDTEALIMCEGEFEALILNRTCLADPLGLTGGTTLFREERLRVCLRTQRLILPFLFHGAKQLIQSQFQRGTSLGLSNVQCGLPCRILHALAPLSFHELVTLIVTVIVTLIPVAHAAFSDGPTGIGYTT